MAIAPRALNESPDAMGGKRARVERAAARLRHLPGCAHGLATHRRPATGILLPEGDFFPKLIRGTSLEVRTRLLRSTFHGNTAEAVAARRDRGAHERDEFHVPQGRPIPTCQEGI